MRGIGKKSEPVTRRPEYAVSRPVFRPNPATWGLFSPLFAAHSPETRRFRPAAPLLSRKNPAGSRRLRAAAARFSRFPPGTAPRLPPETRPLCAVSRRTRPLLPRQPGFFLLCARALPAIPPVLCPKPPHAPQPPTLGVRHRPELGSRWGFHPARLHRFAVVKRVPPRGASIPGSDFQETAAQSRTKFRKIQGFFPACHVAA